MKKKSVQFSVVREDPEIEMRLVQDFGIERATLIASGGCTAFCLKALNPDLEITLIEPNPAQVVLIREKISTFENQEKNKILEKFGVKNSLSDSLIERGNFESLFRQFRLFVQEFIISETEIRNAFINNSAEIWHEVFRNSYWSVAFELFFSDAILRAMFGQSAIQHAPKNSYPRYFQKFLEKGLIEAVASENYFLHHIFLGRYFADALPFYLENFPRNFEFDFFCGFAENYTNFSGRQLVSFSNIFDWCDESVVKQIAGNVSGNLDIGSVIIYRQLNNKKNYRHFFGGKFDWLETSEIIEKDRSLFYENIEIGVKNV